MFYSYEFTNDSDPTKMNKWYLAAPYSIKKLGKYDQNPIIFISTPFTIFTSFCMITRKYNLSR